MMNKAIVTRFAPSPTGFLHIGGVRTALFSYLFARKNDGKFLLRIENTDRERSKKEYEEEIIRGLKWLGMEWDNESPMRQSERGAVYKKYLEKLITEGKAFVSKEEPTEENQRAEVIRLKNSGKEVKFHDLIRGEVTFNTAELGDFVVAKSLDEPIFHFANVVDDLEMGVTHIIRGEDHISNTPRQMLIREALGLPHPQYAHIPLVLAADRSKLSKRHGAVSLSEFMAQGYLPEALINYLALLGWHPEDNREIFTKEELTKVFDLSRVQKSGAIWSTEKLDWVNKEHLLKMNKELRIMNYEKELEKCKIENYRKEILEKLEPILTERINKFGDIKDLADRGELAFFFSQPAWKKEEFLWKGEGNAAETARRIKEAAKLISGIADKNFSKTSVKEAIWPYAEKAGRGLVLWPLRYALSGLPKSPDPFTIAEVLGKEETVNRLKAAAEFLFGC
jgi:glutamyl-tRNA synthetase